MGLTRYGNIDSEHGLAILVGSKFQSEGHDAARHKAVVDALNANDALNILVLDFEDQHFDEAKVTQELQKFFKENTRNTVMNAIHGSTVAPFTDHYSVIGPAIKNSPLLYFGDSVANFLHGNSVWSGSILKAIGAAAEGNPLDVWQFSCQGGKLLPHAENFLPEGSRYVTESEGYIFPEVFLNTLVGTLKANQDFAFDDLYKDYLAMHSKMGGFLFPGMMNPQKVTIGEAALNAIQQSDRLIGEIRAKTVDPQMLTKAIAEHCERIEQAKITIPAIGWNQEGIDYINAQSAQDCLLQALSASNEAQRETKKTNAACINLHNQRDFISSMLLDMVDDWLPVSLHLWDMPANCLGAATDTRGVFESVAEAYYSRQPNLGHELNLASSALLSVVVLSDAWRQIKLLCQGLADADRPLAHAVAQDFKAQLQAMLPQAEAGMQQFLAQASSDGQGKIFIPSDRADFEALRDRLVEAQQNAASLLANPRPTERQVKELFAELEDIELTKQEFAYLSKSDCQKAHTQMVYEYMHKEEPLTIGLSLEDRGSYNKLQAAHTALAAELKDLAEKGLLSARSVTQFRGSFASITSAMEAIIPVAPRHEVSQEVPTISTPICDSKQQHGR